MREALSALLCDLLECSASQLDTRAPLTSQGLSSIQASRLWMELLDRWDTEVSLEWLAEQASASDVDEMLGDSIEAVRDGEVATPLAPRAEFPLTALQESYIGGSYPELTDDPVGCQHYVEFTIELLDVDRLLQAWQRVLARHPMLRSVRDAGTQRIDAERALPAVQVHRTADGGERQRSETRRRLAEHRFDPDGALPYAIEIVSGAEASTIHVVVDSVVTDGHGFALVLEDWSSFYSDLGARLLPAGDPGAFVNMIVDAHRGPRHETDVAYWVEQLKLLAPGPVPRAPRLVDAVSAGSGERPGHKRIPMSAVVSPGHWSKLRQRAASAGVTPSSLLLAAFAEALAGAGAGPDFSLVVTTTERIWLPPEAGRTVGPFTSAMVVPVHLGRVREADAMVLELAGDLHRQTMAGLAHASASSVEVLRAMRSSGNTIPPLPVVFTSMIDAGPDGRMDLGFNRAVDFSVSRTSGVFLDHQTWEQDGALHIRWDVAHARFEPGAVESAFARYLRGLTSLAAPEPAPGTAPLPLNPLQQAYFVARRDDATGCQIYKSFVFDRPLDPGQASRAVLRLVAANPWMRRYLITSGQVQELPAAVEHWPVPVVDLDAAADPVLAREAIVADMTGRAFAVGVWPHFDIRITRGDGPDTLHCAFDVALFDAPTVHRFCKDLALLCADENISVAPLAGQAGSGADRLTAAEATEYWDAQLAELPPGPTIAVVEDPGPRRRLAGELTGLSRLTRHGLAPDALLLAALTNVLRIELSEQPFSVAVVRWPAAIRGRDGEATAMSWIEATAPGTALLDTARRYEQQLARDAAADAVSGLNALRRRAMKRRAHGDFAHRIVYSSVVDVGSGPLPDGVREGRWRSCTPDVSLDCIATADGDRLQYCWDIDGAAFPVGWPDAAFARYGRLLAELFAPGGGALPTHAGELSIAEQRQVVYGWNDTALAFPQHRLAHDAIVAHALAHPGDTAIRSARRNLTFGELLAEAEHVAAELTRRSIGRGDFVAVSVRRNPEMAVATLGVLMAGAAYVPIEPGLPRQRAATMLGLTGARAVLRTTDTTGWEPPVDVARIDVDALDAVDDGEALGAQPNRPQARSDDLAYVIFTSGSTGQPKGVAVTHRAVANLLQWCERTYGFGRADRGLCVTSLGFDLSVFDLFGVLGCGGSLYIADEEQQRDPAQLLNVLLTERITFWNSAPTSLAQIAPLLADADGSPSERALRLVFLSGDYTPLGLPAEISAAFPGARIVSLGGATEATVWSNYFPVDLVNPQWRSIPYGRPIDNARYYVLDADLQPCPAGTEGDLFIAGECLAAGYWAEPALTAQRFRPDPFSAQPGQRMYDTGDRAAYQPDGTLIFLGRADSQVKIRGFRVELGEIEHRLRQHPDIKDVVVLAKDANGDRRLVAYLVPAGDRSPTLRDLRDLAAQTLPDYMLPNQVCIRSAFPATANGKLDRDALPWPVTQSAAQSDVRAAAEADLRAEIIALFAEQLDASNFDADADIWDQGATSFTIVQVSNVLQQRHGCRISISAVLAEPTVNGIARHVSADLAGRVPDPPREPAAPAAPAAPAPPPDPARQATPTVATADAHAARRDEVDFFSASERLEFKAEHRNQRTPSGGGPAVRLAGRGELAAAAYLHRATTRQFAPGPVSSGALGALLEVLRPLQDGERVRFRYPSAGDTYAVQVYVQVRRDGVAGVPAGAYVYRAERHELEPLRATAPLGRTAHFYYNREIADAAGFEVFLVGETSAIEPLYGPNAERYLAIEAGHIGQLLMSAQVEAGLGLCPVGEVSDSALRSSLDLTPSHRFLLGFIGGGRRTEDNALASPADAPVAWQATEGGLAVIGMAGRFPGADDVDELWRNLLAGRRATAVAQPQREAQVGAGRAGGFLDDIGRFDAALFGVPADEATALDPQLRSLLEQVWACLENAGHTAQSLRHSAARVGVYVASMWRDYEFVQAAPGQAQPSVGAGEIAQRVSHVFGFTGPSVGVDTSCSSFLTALHLAAESIRTGGCDAALVAGVNLLAHPRHAELLATWGLTATDSHSGAFDLSASGWLPGEAVGAVLIRPVGAALAAGDGVHAVVEATYSGYSAGSRLGVPDVESLAAAVQSVLGGAGAVGYVELAASGAAMGDIVEIEALSRALPRDPAGPVPVGTLKHNIGHAEAASGLAQLVKAVHSVASHQIAPSPRPAELNPVLPWEHLPVRVGFEAQTWPAHLPRRALIDSISASGAHAFAVLGPAPAAPPRPQPPGPHVFPLSAQTPAQLRELATRLAGELPNVMTRASAADIAYTMQTGRVSHACRIAVVCDDVAELTVALLAAAAGAQHPALQAPGPAAAWVAGEDIDWAANCPRPMNRVALPTYPFAQTRFWPPVPVPDPAELDVTVPAVANGQDPAATLDDLLRRFAAISGRPREEIDPTAPTSRYGLTSELALRVVADLRRDYDDVPSTLLFEHANLADAAHRLVEHVAPDRLSTDARAGDDTHASTGRSGGDVHAVAIVGIAGRFPGARDVAQFWQLLAEGRDMVGPLPAERRRADWNAPEMWGGFLDGVDEFDPMFFGITPRDADLMDPQERQFLEVAWEALEDAGYPQARLHEAFGGRVGVFAATMYSEYPFFGVERSMHGKPVSTGSSISGIANRVSYFLDLNGPSLTVDTMCSSSLTALHLAVTSVRAGECDAALVGGVNLSLHPIKWVEQAALGMSSPTHRCNAFGLDGDGFVPGEGVGVLLVKPLAAARAAGDRIHAVIRSSAVNHGGRTTGYSVPSAQAQGAVIRRAIRDAGVAPGSIGYLEAHGTGTELGDPIEIAGLASAFGGELGSASCSIGSVKTNIGHLEGAAGIAGVIKVVLQLRHRTLVPSLHAEQLNPHVDWANAPFRVQRELVPWQAPLGAARRAGVSSFGAGGSNAFCLLEEAPPAQPWAASGAEQLVVVSARDAAALTEVVARLLEGIGEIDDTESLAYTLQVGREPLPQRLAFAAATMADVRDRLCLFLTGESDAIHTGRVSGMPRAAARGDLEALAAQWVRGATVDWGKLHPAGRPPLVELPAYPFRRRRHWLPDAQAEAPSLRALPVPVHARTWHEVTGGAQAVRSRRPVCVHRPDQLALAQAAAARLGGVALEVNGGPLAIGALMRAYPDVDGWLDLCDLGGDPGDTWPERFDALRVLLARRRPTRAMSVVRGIGEAAEMGALLASLDAELPTLDATVLAVGDAEVADSVAAEWARANHTVQVRRVGDVPMERALAPALITAGVPDLDRDSTYVVAGGTGTLGRIVAEHLVARGARHIALLAHRSGAADRDVAGQRRALERAGASVAVYYGELDDSGALRAFLEEQRLRHGPIKGVVHCAGTVLAPSPLLSKPIDTVRDILRPKVAGVRALADLCASEPLDFFVLFSSVAGVAAALSVGVGDYAAANAFLDAWAEGRREHGDAKVSSIAWAPWQASSKAAVADGAAEQAGLADLATADALSVLDAVLCGGAPAAIVVTPPGPGYDPERLLRRRDHAGAPAGAANAAEPDPSAPGWLHAVFARTLRMDPVDLDAVATFDELGVESMLIAELVTAIEAVAERPLEPTVLLEHRTLADLQAHLDAAGYRPAERPLHEEPGSAPDTPSAGTGAAIAVIGLACRFPEAPDAGAFWRNLASGRCSVSDVPSGRWDVASLYDAAGQTGRSISKWGGFVDGIEEFDPGYFSMTDAQAVNLDPAARLMLETSASCLRDAGCDEARLPFRDVGVYVGARLSDYGRRVPAGARRDAAPVDQNFLAGLVAHQFDLTGPNLVVDTACSSSLVALQLAVRALQAKDATLALVGGVDILLDAQPYLEFSAMGALSRSGRCRTFDESADGFVPGEGCGVILLKPLQQALADGDRIRAVIDAVAVGNDGRTMGLTTPNPNAQSAVIRSALAESGRDTEQVGMVEAHGTATRIGDPIELRALTAVYREQSTRNGWCPIGSVKSSVGHLFSAAGMAGLIKVVLSMEHGEVPATLFCEHPNPRFDFATSPFWPVSERTPWPAQNGLRVGAVSSFGLGGTNAHVIVSRADFPAGRDALPAPRFARRRLWLDAPGAASQVAVAPAAASRSSLLDLVFELPAANGGVNTEEERWTTTLS